MKRTDNFYIPDKGNKNDISQIEKLRKEYHNLRDISFEKKKTVIEKKQMLIIILL